MACRLLLVLAVALLVRGSTASCPKRCKCETRESEFILGTYGAALNCSSAGLKDAYVTDQRDSPFIYLSLSSNVITRVNRDAFPLGVFGGVQEITLSENSVSSVDADAFAGLSELRSLALDRNAITSLPAGVFDTNVKLAFLDLSGNYGLELPDRGYNVSSLTWLGLSVCDLEAIPPSFFDGNPNLQYVYLSHNRLSHIAPDALRALSGSVMYLDLYANQFTRIQPELLQLLPVTVKLYLYENPFHCDCEFKRAFALYERRAYVTVPSCKTPENLRAIRADQLETVLKCD